MIDRILELMQKHKINQREICESLQINRSSVTEWKSGKIKPTLEILIKISELFGVSIDYLVTGKVNLSLDDILTEDEKRLLNDYRMVTERDKGELLGRAAQMAAPLKQEAKSLA